MIYAHRNQSLRTDAIFVYMENLSQALGDIWALLLAVWIVSKEKKINFVIKKTNPAWG